MARMTQQRLRAALLSMALAGWGLAAGAASAQDLQAEHDTIAVDGMTREYLLHVPAEISRPAPLVLVFHGGGGRPEGIMRTSGMNDIADRRHFIVAYPAGTGRSLGPGGTWNVGGSYSPSSADDVGFVQAVLRDIERRYPIDHRRIYATGESMGGVFAYRLACEMSDTFAAIGVVAATQVEPNCHPRSPVAVLHIHGTADENIPINGGTGAMTGGGRSWPPPERGIRFWAQFDGCTGADHTSSDGPEATCETFGRCKTAVEYCVIAGGGHAWPGSEPLRWQQLYHVHVSQTFPASERIWAFFSANPKR